MIISSKFCITTVVGVVGLALAWEASAGALGSSLKTQTGINTAAGQSQKRIDKLEDQTDTMLQEYRLVTTEADSLKTYNDQLEVLVNAQQAELDSMSKQLEQIEVTTREVVPMMLKMIDALDQFVKLDVPFLQDERSERLLTLKDIMDRSDVTTSEKYRQIIEAYQVEMEYGRTIEAYRGELKFGDSDVRTVDYLRIGRLILIYQTLDGKQAGVWDNKARKWTPVDSGYHTSINAALRVARKQAAPDLLKLPVAGAEEVK